MAHEEHGMEGMGERIDDPGLHRAWQTVNGGRAKGDRLGGDLHARLRHQTGKPVGQPEFMMEPKMATPKELPMERKKTFDEVAVPRSSWAVAFWMATIITGMIMPTPAPSGIMNRPAFQTGVCLVIRDSRNIPAGIRSAPDDGPRLVPSGPGDKRPVAIEVIVIPTIRGRSSRPDRVGDSPVTSCRNSGRYTVPPNIAMPARKPAALVTLNTLLRNRRSGSTGSSARPSRHTNRTTRTPVATISDTISTERPAVGGAAPHGDQQQRGHRRHQQCGAGVVDTVLDPVKREIEHRAGDDQGAMHRSGMLT